MTVRRAVDLTRPDSRQAETPSGLPPLATYRASGMHDAVVLDAGSWQYRAGYASKELPARSRCAHHRLTGAVVFDPTVHRYQQRAGDVVQYHAGRSAPPGTVRLAVRSPYEDGPVVLHPPTLEHLLDHVFAQLAVPSGAECVQCPVFMTEAAANPPYCRRGTRGAAQTA